MTGPVTFAPTTSKNLAVLFGPRLIGDIVPYPKTLASKLLGQVGAHYRYFFTNEDSETATYGATSVEQAKKQIITRLADFHEAINPELYAPMIAALREQAEGYR